MTPNSKLSKPFFTTQQLVLTALFTAVTCILAPLAIPVPFSPVPISFTNFVLFISIFLLGWKHTTISYIIYLLLGLAGLPVFSGFTGGPGKLAGPTGGYLIGFIFLTIIGGICVERFPKKRWIHIIGMIAGSIIAYAFGTIWLIYQLNLTVMGGLAAGVLPYLPGDAAKIVIALIIAPLIKKRLSLGTGVF